MRERLESAREIGEGEGEREREREKGECERDWRERERLERVREMRLYRFFLPIFATMVPCGMPRQFWFLTWRIWDLR